LSRRQTPRFGELLKTLRIAARLTQEALAERAGLSVRGLQDLERGQSLRPRRDTVELLAIALTLSTADRAALLALAAPQPQRPLEAPQSGGPLDPGPGVLPAPLTALLGRAREVEEVSALLLREEVRLLTLTGPGGVGKTRLALQVVGSLSEHMAGGVTFVDLTPLRDARLVPHAIAQALGLAERGGQRLLEALVAYLQARPMLLLLDNAEHILEAVAEVAALRAACPALRLLVTSRVALRVQGEQVYPVPPLALPTTGEVTSPEGLEQVAAAALFVQRARAVRPDFALTEVNAAAVAAICARLDGLPLAIELAAVRVESLTAGGIAARLDDSFRLLTGGARDALPRHRTLRAALDWSYDLLSPPEQQLLERLVVFAGGWTLPAAEVICTGGAVEDQAMLDLLSELVHKSLVQIQETHGDFATGCWRPCGSMGPSAWMPTWRRRCASGIWNGSWHWPRRRRRT
jgi:predicted ATPase/DNA-binding XRE family transcriptional regulator